VTKKKKTEIIRDDIVGGISHKFIIIVLTVLTLVGLGLRSYNLGMRALHNDEALQLNGIQTQSFEQLIQHCTHVDMHPPLSYLLEKVVYHFTDSIFMLRFISVIFGVMAIPLIYWALYTLVGKRVALIAAALSVVSYELIWYSRELRDYIFFYLFVVAAFGFFVRILQDDSRWPNWKNVAGFIVMNVLATYSHFNTYLTWPVYGFLFLLWHIEGLKVVLRWQYIAVLFISAIIIITAVFPTFFWFAEMRKVQGVGAFRPGIVALYKMLAPLGYGLGWRFFVWMMLVGCGIWQGIRRHDKSIVILGGWVLVPIVAYIYVIGVPPKFIKLFYRYMVILQLGLLGLMAYGVDQIALWMIGKKEKVLNYFCGLLVLLTVIIMSPIFHAYYGLTATDRLYKEIGETLNKLAPRCLFLDNYYEMQYLRHYLPEGVSVAFPPIFNNDKEYQRLDAHGFTRKALESDPMLLFFDAGNIRRRSRMGRDVKWLKKHFSNKQEFINRKGVYLYKCGLNLFAMNDFDKRVDRIYYNNIKDLPKIYSEKGVSGIAFGPDWYGMTIMGMDGKWKFLRVAGNEGTLYYYNNKSSSGDVLRFAMHGCAVGQNISIFCDKKLLLHHCFNDLKLDIFDLRTRKRFQQHIALAPLLKQYNGVLNLPLAVRVPVEQLKLDASSIDDDLQLIRVKCRSAAGVVVDNIRVLNEI